MPPRVTKALRSVSLHADHPSTSFLGLHQRASFFNLVRSSDLTLSVSEEFWKSSSVTLINPRHHRIATDQISLRLPAISFSGMNDDAVLTLFTRGFFEGWVFSVEKWIMKMGGWRILPARYTGTLFTNPQGMPKFLRPGILRLQKEQDPEDYLEVF